MGNELEGRPPETTEWVNIQNGWCDSLDSSYNPKKKLEKRGQV